MTCDGTFTCSKSPLEELSKNYLVVVIPLLWAADVLVCPLITLDTSFKRADREVCRAQYQGLLESPLRADLGVGRGSEDVDICRPLNPEMILAPLVVN